MSNSLRTHGLQHARPPCPSRSPGVSSKIMSIESVMPSNHLILCHSLLLLPSVFPSIRVFSNESGVCIRWPKYWRFSFSISPSNDYSGLISFRIDRFDHLAVQGTLKSLLQHHSLKASIIQCSAFFMVQLCPVYCMAGDIPFLRYKLRNSQVEEMHRAGKAWEKGTKLPCSLQVPLSPSLHSPTWGRFTNPEAP